MIADALNRKLPAELVAELLEAYSEAKRNFRSRGLRLSAVEGGRFCEAVFRILEHRVWQRHTPLSAPLDSESLIRSLAQLPSGSQPDSVRLHIPRALRVVYDIRNKRDAAHLADGIDPNLQDGTLVIAVLDWVLAEMVRLYFDSDPNRAFRIINTIVQYETPLVQDFDGHLKVLDPSLKAGDACLALLYSKGAEGAILDDLKAWVRPSMRTNLRRTLKQLCDVRGLVHFDGARFLLTESGIDYVQGRLLEKGRSRVA